LGFEGGGEGLPFGEEGGALVAELRERGGDALGVFGGGEVGEGLLGGGDEGFQAGNLSLNKGEAVFELFLLDGVEALDGGGGLGGRRSSFAR
jgi:hypothetical protein